MYVCKSTGKIIGDKDFKGCRGCNQNIFIHNDSERYVAKKCFDKKWGIWDNYRQHFKYFSGSFKRKKDALNTIDEMEARKLAKML